MGFLSLLLICPNGGQAEGGEPSGVEAFPYIEATEIAPKGEFSDIRTVRTYRAGRGDTMIVSSTAFVVPWAWEEREIKAFCKPSLKVTEGELIETKADLWEESSRTNYPCVAVGSKVMVNRRILTVRAERGVITTVGERRQPVRAGSTIIIPEEGVGDRFVALTLSRRGGGAVKDCGSGEDGGVVDLEEGAIEHRWKAVAGKEISINTYSIQ